MEQALEATSPVGRCETCRFFIDDPQEIGQELRHIANGGRTVIKTVERAGGEALTPMETLISIDQALEKRTGLRLSQVGLCEKGVATFVARDAGSRGNDRCSKWIEKGALTLLRSPNWRNERERALNAALAAVPVQNQHLAFFDRCPCESGKAWGFCCRGKSAR